jgi:hypothetical protein
MTCGFDDLTATAAAAIGGVDHGVTAIYGAEQARATMGFDRREQLGCRS